MQKLEEVFKRVSDCFIWSPDIDTFGVNDYWDGFLTEVLSGGVVRRDCEDFAITCLLLGIQEYGFDKSKCRIARVRTESGEDSVPLNHAIAIYDGMVFDNRQRRVVPISYLSDYKFFDYCSIPISDWYMYESGIKFLENGSW